MKNYQREFLDFAFDCGALRFGKFTLKSGRISPYFFNIGLFNTGHKLTRLGWFYAQAIQDSAISYDMIFGPAYKGVPLACATVMSITDRDVPFAFNRKESKLHGEGGSIIGYALKGKVLIIDDVISAGTSIRESLQTIKDAGANPAGVVIALDRQELGEGSISAVQEVERNLNLPVASIVKLETLLNYLDGQSDKQVHLDAIKEYRRTYGV